MRHHSTCGILAVLSAALLALAVQSPFALAALNDVNDVVGWNSQNNPFDNNPNSGEVSIEGATTIASRAGIRSSVTWTCDGKTSELGIGISGDTLDEDSRGQIKVRTKFDAGTTDPPLFLYPDNRRHFTLVYRPSGGRAAAEA